MEMKEKYSKGELAKEILKGLAIGGFIVACFVAPNFAQVAKLFNTEGPRDKKRLLRAFNNLNKHRLVKISYNKKGEQIIKITEDGKKRILKYEYQDLKIDIPKKWDKIWRLVIFDIPEVHKKARDAMTFKLQDMGFYPLQKSVFITPYDCKDKLDFICEYFDISEFVNYFVIKKVEEDSRLRKHFGLN
ncbi:hypothetical protein KKA27_03175 [Patescibacteria group bacterium]|nr:hypothetical protein [Patescibacteria group bacterium]MBU2633550.1 hypothetical protein [Patescibacteria group bacterium]